MPRRDRSSHVGKTPNERSAYQRYIRRLESQPTIEEPTNIEPSFEAKQELAESTSRRIRTIPFSLQLRDHFEKNWIAWAFVGLLAIATFLLNDARVNIAILSNNLSSQGQDIDRMSASLEDHNEINHAQDLLIQEIGIRLEFLLNNPIPAATQTLSAPTPTQSLPTPTSSNP